MAIKLDFTNESVVVVCDKCPGFRALRIGRTAAWGAAADHERAAHEGEKQATLAHGMSRQRDLQANLQAQAAKLNPYVST
jgi:hypothetical protein